MCTRSVQGDNGRVIPGTCWHILPRAARMVCNHVPALVSASEHACAKKRAASWIDCDPGLKLNRSAWPLEPSLTQDTRTDVLMNSVLQRFC